MVIDKVRQYFDHPGFVAPFTEGVEDGLAELEERLPGIDLATEARVLFSHALHPVVATPSAAVPPPAASAPAAPTRRSTARSPRS